MKFAVVDLVRSRINVVHIPRKHCSTQSWRYPLEVSQWLRNADAEKSAEEKNDGAADAIRSRATSRGNEEIKRRYEEIHNAERDDGLRFGSGGADFTLLPA